MTITRVNVEARVGARIIVNSVGGQLVGNELFSAFLAGLALSSSVMSFAVIL